MIKRSLLFSCILIGTVAVYSTFVEPVWLQISSYEITADVKKELTIAHLTDLHLHKFGIIERKILNILNAKRPDLVLITGDTLDGPQSIPAAMKFFSGLKPPRLGVWAVLGNWEHWSGNATRKLFHSFGVQLLINEGIGISNELMVFGFDDSLSGKPERALASEVDSRKVFCVDMIHSPQLADEIVHRCPLILAGHTHGGQVRLPFIPPLWLPERSGKYIAGWYDFPDARMYVSRGIGTSILPIRFLARPEIVFVTIRSRH